ncbi:caffeoylshikimate esterase-like [Olea europaea subsp. europaea]|uniref:Caffeoylshikimate esterase-like n=1 Tax=Olea europaea subsp. europaea TaxID=158383 RepID=A0A8S0PA16_OLEEU|nr:caffeoylshikimate esterase-like [Olea europaea subsp. europaea]
MAHPIYEANENSPYGNLSRYEFYKKHRILHRESYMTNEQNVKIFTQSWQPADSTYKFKGLIGMIHGYTSESSWLFELNAVAMAKSGFFVCALDLQGHGFSEGSPDHIPDIQPLICDCISYFNSARADHPNLPPFLYGESLGAALAVRVCLKQRTAWKGLVLSGAMCEISKKIRPVWPIEKLLPTAAFIAPSWRIVITQPPASRSYKEEWKRKLIERSPNRQTCGKSTAASALQLLRVCEYVKKNCHDLEVPILIVHGGEDMICDPEGAKFLYQSSSSKDKTLKIFTGMWHQLIGEPNESAEEVFNNILSWIEMRADLSSTN